MERRIDDMMEQIAIIQTDCAINKNTIERVSTDFSQQTALLTKTVKKAEHDRMSKYYKQVGELNDWRLKVQESIENNIKITDAVSTHFSVENQVYSLNKISEILLRVLDGHEYNRLIDVVNEKQTYLARKKLGMSKHALKDRIMLSCRALKEKQPLPQMPEKIPDDKLPPSDMNQMLSQMKAKDQKKKSKKKLRSISSSKSNGRGDKSEGKS